MRIYCTRTQEDYNSLMVELVLVPFYRGAVVFKKIESIIIVTDDVLVPFYRGAVVFKLQKCLELATMMVLAPFYRGAVVFKVLDKLKNF